MKYWLALDGIQIVRIVAVVMVSACFTIAAARGWPSLARLVPFLVSIALSQLAITIHNDRCDLALDARAKPWRSLATGMLTPKSAMIWTVSLSVLAIAAALPLGLGVPVLVAVGIASGFAYNAGLKRGVWCWLPFLVALPTLVVCAFLVVGRFETNLWLVYVIGAPLVVAIYLADTLADIDVDTSLGVNGLAQRLGPARARLVCWVCVALAQAIAYVVWPPGRAPGVLFILSVSLLVGGIALGFSRGPRSQWLAIMGSAASLAIGWLLDLGG